MLIKHMDQYELYNKGLRDIFLMYCEMKSLIVLVLFLFDCLVFEMEISLVHSQLKIKMHLVLKGK